jgi:cell division control protein 6
LYTAGDLARSNDDEMVTEQHVRQAEEEIQQGAIVSEIASLSPQGKLVAYTLLALDAEGELPAKMDAFYAWYEHAARLAETDTVTARTVRDLLNDLVINGVAKMEEINRGQRGGRHYRYSLAARPDMIVDGLAEDDTITKLDAQRGGTLFG